MLPPLPRLRDDNRYDDAEFTIRARRGVLSTIYKFQVNGQSFLHLSMDNSYDDIRGIMWSDYVAPEYGRGVELWFKRAFSSMEWVADDHTCSITLNAFDRAMMNMLARDE